MGDSLYAGLGIDVNGDGQVNEGDWDSQEDKKIIRDAITNKNNKHYNYESSKKIVAEYLTMNAEKKLYGEMTKDGRELTGGERNDIEPNEKETPEK